jgi:hypothetical protein
MGFFDQPVTGSEREKDSNKYYHAAVVKSKKNGKWYAYFQWGRTGASSPSYQFVECSNESEAQAEYEKQCHSKNDKRGEWTTIAGIKTLQPKEGKDAYLVRAMATRSTGLPNAKCIKMNEGAKQKAVPVADTKDGKTAAKTAVKKVKVHTEVVKLLRDLGQATVNYTKSSMADASLPTQVALDEGRTLLLEATKRIGVIGDDITAQVKDKDLFDITKLMYSRIPKIKPVGAGPETWVLSQDNIKTWNDDLDAFESALYAEVEEAEIVDNPYGDMPLEMDWIDPKSTVGKFLYDWWPKASKNAHYGVGPMKIKNMWEVRRHDDQKNIPGWQAKAKKEIDANGWKIKERPLFQPTERPDMTADEFKLHKETNTSMMFHGTRSVNVSGILRSALRLPKQLVGVAINGAMFGPGIYWADDWRKSAGYTSLSGSRYATGYGGIASRGAFMFVADVVVGMPWVAPSSGGYTKPPENKHTVFGKAGHSGVVNNEWIIFDNKQNNLRYLCEFAA